jgi:hypothetical protein
MSHNKIKKEKKSYKTIKKTKKNYKAMNLINVVEIWKKIKNKRKVKSKKLN